MTEDTVLDGGATLFAQFVMNHTPMSATVTFKVENGAWDDGTTEDRTVTLDGYTDQLPKLTADQIPAVGTKPNDTYKAGSWDVTPSAETEITEDTTYTYTYADKDSISRTVTFKVANGSWDDETTADKTVTLNGLEGDTLKLSANQIPAVGEKPDANYKAGSWDTAPSTETAITENVTYTYTYVTNNNPTPVPSSSSSSSSSSSGSSGSGKRTYTVKSADVTNGSVKTSVRQAGKDAVVTITLQPNAGYETQSVTVKTLAGTEIPVTRNADGTFSYTQPASNVTVTPVFAPITASNPAPDNASPDNSAPEPDSTSAPEPDSAPSPESGNAAAYTTENPAPPDVTGVSQRLITETHPAYIGGFSDGTFRPNDNITRAQAASMFFRLLKNPNVSRSASFSDMTGNEWYAEAVYALSGMGIIQGYSDGGFHGNDRISRAAFAAIAVRLAEANGETGTGVQFDDVPANHWGSDAIARASGYGWIGGYSDGTFHPADPITRAAVTAIINRMLGRSADAAYVAEHGDSLKRFSDVSDPNAWYYYNVAEAANGYDFTVSEGKERWNA